MIGPDGNREEVIEKFKSWVGGVPSATFAGRVLPPFPLRDVEELRGKDLVCWCAPHPCHADILLAMANEVKR